MSKGKIKEYDSKRGCGIISDHASGQELIVYANYVTLKEGELLKIGQEVEYEIENQRSDIWAVNVTVVSEQQ